MVQIKLNPIRLRKQSLSDSLRIDDDDDGGGDDDDEDDDDDADDDDDDDDDGSLPKGRFVGFYATWG